MSELRHLTRTTITAETRQSAASLSNLAGVHGLEIDGNHVRFEVDASHLDAAVARLSELGVQSLVSHPPTLEELFLRQYRDDLARDQARVQSDGDPPP